MKTIRFSIPYQDIGTLNLPKTIKELKNFLELRSQIEIALRVEKFRKKNDFNK